MKYWFIYALKRRFNGQNNNDFSLYIFKPFSSHIWNMMTDKWYDSRNGVENLLDAATFINYNKRTAIVWSVAVIWVVSLWDSTRYAFPKSKFDQMPFSYEQLQNYIYIYSYKLYYIAQKKTDGKYSILTNGKWLCGCRWFYIHSRY